MSRLPGKRARPVLRGLRRSNAPELPDEHVGHGSAYRLEWLLNGAKWDADARCAIGSATTWWPPWAPRTGC